MKAEIEKIATEAALAGAGVLVIGRRQNFIGRLESITDTALTLVCACVAFNTGKLSDKKIALAQRASGATATIVIPLAAIDAVLVGKPVPDDLR